MLPDRLKLGDTDLFQFLPYSQITDQIPSIQELNKLLSSLNFRGVLITLARMGLAFSRSRNVEQRCKTENALRNEFCPPCYKTQIQLQGLDSNFIFNRFAGIRLLSESCRISQQDSSPDVSDDWMHDLGECVLMMNDFLVPEVEEEPLFSLSLDLSELADEQTTPEELRFKEKNGIFIPQDPLSEFLTNQNACIRSAEVGKQWDVEDGDLLYAVRRAEGKTDVYDEVEERNHLLVEQIPYFEYGDKYHNIPEKMVRSKELLSLAQNSKRVRDSKIDIQAEFSKATGLTLREYQCLIFYTLVHYLDLTLEDVLEGDKLFIPSRPLHLEDLYDKLLKHNGISIDELPNEVYNSLVSTPINEFRIFRDKPLVKMGENAMICIDFNFLADKLESGIFWIIFNQLKESDRGKLFPIWGDAFAKYVGSILKRSVSNADSETENVTDVSQRLIPSPQYSGKQEGECTDFIIHTDETLILMECKAGKLTADAKYNGKFHDLERELKAKFVDPDGLRQLRDAILKLADKNEGNRSHIEDVDISQIRKIYPVLIVLDETFSTQWMNWYLDRQFQGIFKQGSIPSDLEVAPLSVLTSTDLEYLEPYLTDTPFHKHLDDWIEFYQQHGEFPAFRSYVYTLRNNDSRENQFIVQQFDQIGSDMLQFFSQRGVQ